MDISVAQLNGSKRNKQGKKGNTSIDCMDKKQFKIYLQNFVDPKFRKCNCCEKLVTKEDQVYSS